MHVISVLLSEMVRSNAQRISTKTAIIRYNPRGDRDTTHASYRTPCTFQCHFRANPPRLLLKIGKFCEYVRVLAGNIYYSTTRSMAAKKTLNSSGKVRILDEAPVPPRTTPSIRRHYFARKSSNPVVELAVYFYQLRRYSNKASEHLPKKGAIDRVVGLLQVDEKQERQHTRFPSQLL